MEDLVLVACLMNICDASIFLMGYDHREYGVE